MAPIVIGEEYYRLVGKKEIAEIGKYLHPAVVLRSPLAQVEGKEAVIDATRNFAETFTTLFIRAKFGNQTEAMLVYDVDMPNISRAFPGASLLTFREGLIAKIELFYDGAPFVEMRREIFS